MDCLVNQENCFKGLTVSLWLRGDNFLKDQAILSTYSSDRGLNLRYQLSTNSFLISLDDDAFNLKMQFTLVQNTWSHVILTWNSTTDYTLLVNGVQPTVVEQYVAIATKNQDKMTLKFGGSTTTPADYFCGALDDVWFRSECVLPADVLDIYSMCLLCVYTVEPHLSEHMFWNQFAFLTTK